MRSSLLGWVIVAAALVACDGSSDDESGGGGSGAAGGAGGAGTGATAPSGGGGSGGSGGGPTLPELEPGWNEFNPGGDTICSRGTDYAYWVYPGTVNKVIVDFIGGGACWNELTCGLAGAIFEDSVDAVRARIEAGMAEGFYDHDNEENPFKDWYHVIVPYCTGDIHWGDATQVYGEGTEQEITIHHRGAVNSRAVLGWVYDNFAEPEQVLVTGCSAGSYGSALWAADVMRQYPDAEVFQFGDSGAGIITEQFFMDSFPSWNAEAAFPKDIEALDPELVDLQSLALPDLYVGIANHYENQWMSQYNTIADDNQTFYFEAMGGSGVEEWTMLMLSSIDEIEGGASNFASFTAPGEQHCILPYDNFYTVESNGVKLTDWLRALLEGSDPGTVICDGAECDLPTP